MCHGITSSKKKRYQAIFEYKKSELVSKIIITPLFKNCVYLQILDHDPRRFFCLNVTSNSNIRCLS